MPPSPSSTAPRPGDRAARLALPVGAGLALAASLAALAYYLFRVRPGEVEAADAARVADLVAAEELILRLTPELGALSHDLRNFQLPGTRRDLFATEVEVTDLAPGADGPAEEKAEAAAPGGLSREVDWPIRAAPAAQAGDGLELWSPLLARVEYFENAKFKFYRGSFHDGARQRFDSRVLFAGLARMRDGTWAGISAEQEVAWNKRQGVGPGWEIAEWATTSMRLTYSDRLLFSDRLDQAVPREGDRFRARTCGHSIALLHYYRSNKTKAPSVEFAPIAMNQKPAISVADYNGDGFDDIYVMVRTGKNLLLHNRGDGTFSERAADAELALPGNSTCGIFADFDNDGDLDLMLGRSVERTLYLENAGGWFREVPQPAELPYLAVSMAAADYNGDGLLDVYISTYRRGSLTDAGHGFSEEAQGTSTWCEQFLPPEHAAEFHRRFEESRSTGTPHGGYLDQVGPPNVLLVNRGGRFEIAPESAALSAWKNTLQATWGDYDNDGDPDLYLANDWAPDILFRNDGAAGFADVTAPAGLTDMGFGMGASWGDYDGDGRQDVYVSNMYSKAGQRILARFTEIDPAYTESAEGNFLYRQRDDGTFDRVSCLGPPALAVANAGWSWGGQFADFDNDTDLDIYALSGYFTAPDEFASDVDL